MTYFTLTFYATTLLVRLSFESIQKKNWKQIPSVYFIITRIIESMIQFTYNKLTSVFFLRLPCDTDNKLEDLNWFLVFDRFRGQNIRRKSWNKIQWSY